MALKCPVHSVTPTRVSSPTIDLNENPELRTINAHEEDILFFGPTTITSEGSSVPNVGVVEGPQTLMETILSMELANAVTATEGTRDLEEGGVRANEGGVTHGVVERLGYGPVVMVMVGVGLLIWVCLLVGVIVRRWA